MSYNITAFKVKELDGLVIPVASLYKCERSDWHPDRVNNGDGSTTFTICETELRGTIRGDFFFVDKLDCCGEGSGTAMNWVLEPAFADSTGRLVAVCVWEGGDDITRLVVDGGSVSWQGVEL